MRTDYLRIIFYKKLCGYSTNTALINGTFDELLAQYESSDRHFHDLSHVITLLKHWEEHKAALQDEEVVYLAIWFHDAYMGNWNENYVQQSIELAGNFLQNINFPLERAQKVMDYIAACNADTSPLDHDLKYLLDFNHSIMGADEVIFNHYIKQIANEKQYSLSFLHNEERRKTVLNLLEKPYIFHTIAFRNQYENVARENLQRELSTYSDLEKYNTFSANRLNRLLSYFYKMRNFGNAKKIA
jgi:predicted metal-dependent HD superfamily phosphohydrolase